jgi:hypothetical protein
MNTQGTNLRITMMTLSIEYNDGHSITFDDANIKEVKVMSEHYILDLHTPDTFDINHIEPGYPVRIKYNK